MAVRFVLTVFLLCLMYQVQGRDVNKYVFNVPTLPLNEALIDFAKQANLQLLFDSQVTKNTDRLTYPVNGEMSKGQALQHILEGSSLDYEMVDNVLVIKKIATSKTTHNIEEVMVAGYPFEWFSDSYLESLKNAAIVKENATSMVDNVFANGLGRFSVNSISEALQGIPGVAVSRSRGGEGRFINVRGLGEEFNIVTFNGRLLASENDGREVSFDVIAPELVASAQVYKTAIVNQLDGSLGGLININSAKPLDQLGFHAIGSVATQHETLADTWQPKLSGVISHTWNNDQMGVLGSFAYQKRDIRIDIVESNFLVFPVDVDAAGNASQNQDINNDGISDVSGLPIINSQARFNGFSALLLQQKRERIGATLAYQYRPNDQFELMFDVLYNKLSNPSESNGYSYFPSAFGPGFTTNAVLNDDNQIVSHESNTFAYDALARRTEGDTKTVALGANIKWQLSDKSTMQVDAAYSKAEGQRDNDGSAAGSGAFFSFGVAGGRVQQQFTGRAVPDFTFDVSNPRGSGFIANSELRPEDYNVHFGRNDTLLVDDEVVSLKADYELEFNDNGKLTIRGDYVNRRKINRAFTNTTVACTLCGYATSIGAAGVDVSGLVTGRAPSDFLSNVGADIPRDFDLFDLDVVQAGFISQAPLGTYTPTVNEVGSTDIDETVLGVYVQYDWSNKVIGLPYNANIGLRVSKTDLTSRGLGNDLNDITAVELLNDGVNQHFTFNSPKPLSVNNDYTDVLPSFNISIDLRESLLLRGALSRTVARPTLSNLSTSFSVMGQNRGGEAVTQNNPELEAIQSNNIDLALEWYGEHGITTSAALFYKDMSDFVAQVVSFEPRVFTSSAQEQAEQGASESRTVEFRVQSPENVDDVEILGLELAGQYIMQSGLGASLNLTFVDSDVTSSGIKEGDLESLSDFSAHLSLFYEGEKISSRFFFNYRDEYLVGQTAEGGRDEVVDESLHIDVSFDYKLSDALTVYLEGINVFEEPFFRYSETKDFLESYEESGARWLLGLRGKF